MLRNLRDGWTMDQRGAYIEFINASAKYPGGNSYAKFLGNLRDEVLGYLSPSNGDGPSIYSQTYSNAYIHKYHPYHLITCANNANCIKKQIALTQGGVENKNRSHFSS